MRDFLQVPDSVKGQINRAELYRVFAGSGFVATLTAATAALLGQVASDAPAIFTSPTLASLAALSLTFAADSLRRLGHGDAKQAPRPWNG